MKFSMPFSMFSELVGVSLHNRGKSTTEGNAAELDPAGANAGTIDPYQQNNSNLINDDSGWGYPGFGLPSRMGCRMDGADYNCSLVMREVASGTAVPCPNNNCAPRTGAFRDHNGRVHRYLTPLVLTDTGFQFLIPNSIWQMKRPAVPPTLKRPPKTTREEKARRDAIAATGVFDNEPSPIPNDIIIKIRAALVRLATPDCLDKLRQVFDEAERLTSKTWNKDTAVSSNPLTLFDDVLKQGGFYLGSNSTGTSGSSTGAGAVGAGNATIVLSSNLVSEPYSQSEVEALAYAAFSETIHVAGSKPSYYIGGTFSDVNLARASHSLGLGLKKFDKPQPNLPKNILLTEYPGDANIDPYKDTFGNWSRYNHDSLKQYCKF